MRARTGPRPAAGAVLSLTVVTMSWALRATGQTAPSPDAPPAVPAVEAVEEVVGPLDLAEYPTARVVTGDEARRLGAETLADSLALVLGASPAPVGDRAEAGFSLRGFDLRRVPVYLDGIPVYVPYDGVVDLDRFLMAATGGVVVNSGFSSLTYGPNALGGTVNLLRRRPSRPLEGQVRLAAGSGSLGGLNAAVGSAGKRWYVEATAALRRTDDSLLGGEALQRENSFYRDTLAAVTAGFLPAKGHEIALTLIRQDGEKGQPPYAGDDPAAKARYWRWPDWDKQSVYLRSLNRLGDHSELRVDVFHDTFTNTLNSYDDASYTTQVRKSSFRSDYDDHTNGGKAELRLSKGRWRTTLAVHAKQDVHRDRNNEGPWSRYEDATTSFALEEQLLLGSATRLVAGASFDSQRTAEAMGLPKGDAEALNGALALFHPVGASTEVHAALSRRTRLPTLKDRYSWRLGTSHPNPSLGPESVLSAEAGIGGSWAGAGRWSATLFWSRLDDAIESVPIASNLEQYRNVGRVRHVGAELALERPLASWLEAGVRAGYVERTRLSGADLALTGVPRFRTFAFLSTEATPWLAFRASAEVESGRLSRTPSGAVRSLGGFAVWHVAVRAMLRPGLEAELRCENLLNRHYSREEGYPEPGRALTASLTWAF